MTDILCRLRCLLFVGQLALYLCRLANVQNKVLLVTMMPLTIYDSRHFVIDSHHLVVNDLSEP